jgi:diguanylate cyclase (GGDEF)-like protein
MKQLTADLERRSLAPLILKVLEEIFRPSQALVFFADRLGGTLTLAAATGLEEGTLRPGAKLNVGEGRIGFAARKQICMGPQDFRLESNINLEHIQATELHGVTADLCAPLVSNGRLLGMISMELPKEWASIEVKRLFGMVADVASLALASNLQYRKIQHLASSDPLTGISNKSHFMRRAERVLKDAEAAGHEAGLLFMDLDHFKRFNDTYGHLAGDRVLRGLGDILQQHVREGDIAARFGGEEFVVLLAEADLDTSKRVAERIRLAIRGCQFDGLFRNPDERVTISIGVAVFPDDSRGVDDLIGRSDIALYRAKNAGRDAVRVYSESAEQAEAEAAARAMAEEASEGERPEETVEPEAPPVETAEPVPSAEGALPPAPDFSQPPCEGLEPLSDMPEETFKGGFLDALRDGALTCFDSDEPADEDADDEDDGSPGPFLSTTVFSDKS